MRLLFSSDLHGHPDAYDQFVRLLRGPYDAGILGGDLLDEWLPPDAVDALLGPDPDADLDDLMGEDDDPVAVWHNSAAFRRQTQARAAKVDKLQLQLREAGKPVFFVLGNHDHGEWPDRPWMTNLHGRRVEFQGRAFVGYRWTTMDRKPEEIESDLVPLKGLVDRETVLVTHSPPWGILDGEPQWGAHYGLPMLRRLNPKPWLHLVGHVHSLAGRRGRYINGGWPARRELFAIDVERRGVRRVR